MLQTTTKYNQKSKRKRTLLENIGQYFFSILIFSKTELVLAKMDTFNNKYKSYSAESIGYTSANRSYHIS